MAPVTRKQLEDYLAKHAAPPAAGGDVLARARAYLRRVRLAVSSAER